jgi:ubiquinol-cytochrome c reductase cytochrome b subunit
MPGGEYVEIHQPLDAYERWRLIDVTEYQPLKLRPDERGAVRQTQRLRALLSRFFFEDRIGPVDPSQLPSAEHDDAELHSNQPDRRPVGVGGIR